MENSKKKELINYLLSESHLLDSSEQYLDSVLMGFGYKQDELKEEGNEVVAKLFLKAKAQTAKEELLNILKNAKSKLAQLKITEETTLGKIQELFERKYAAKYAFNFRDIKQMNEKDALSILADLEILDFLDQQNLNDAKTE
jgi:hypothetical protein